MKRNNLGDDFLEALSNCLKYDRFIKVIDLSSNLITEPALKYFVKHSLAENITLVSFSAARNPGYTDKLRKRIALCLLKNLEAYKQSGVEVKEEWVKSENLAVKIPQRILESMGAAGRE